MTRVVVVADRGAAMAELSVALRGMRHVELARHATGGSSVARVVRATAPDVVLIAELMRPAETLTRLVEIRNAAPGAAVVVIAADPSAGWLAEALRRGAAAVLPGPVEHRTLELVLHEVLESADRVVAPTSLAA